MKREFLPEDEINKNGFPNNIFTYPAYMAYINEFYPGHLESFSKMSDVGSNEHVHIHNHEHLDNCFNSGNNHVHAHNHEHIEKCVSDQYHHDN